uniref:Uncharacterized protein n=1 Tax=Lutzomyia longipalpis TaxID=7200 RepID=A0A1B0CV94_LUTLO
MKILEDDPDDFSGSKGNSSMHHYPESSTHYNFLYEFGHWGRRNELIATYERTRSLGSPGYVHEVLQYPEDRSRAAVINYVKINVKQSSPLGTSYISYGNLEL